MIDYQAIARLQDAGTGDSLDWSECLAAARSGAPGPAKLPPSWTVFEPLAAARRANIPFAVAQLGQSLDGRIATSSGHSHYINGQSAIAHLHRLRALADAVVIGAGTVLADDPRLTVRRVEGPNPARVVIDRHGRVPSDANCLKDDGARRIIVQSDNRERPPGVEVVQVSVVDGVMSPPAIATALAGIGLNILLIEGGANTVSRFLAAKCLDRLHLLVAPLLLGSGQAGLELPPIDRLDDALRPEVRSFALGGGDVLFDCALNRRAAPIAPRR
jgi:riboflavin-specific deaminase-like protein